MDRVATGPLGQTLAMVRFLLLPEDEAESLAWARDEHGLQVATPVAEASGHSRIEPLTEFPLPLPGPPAPRSVPSVPTEFFLRRHDWPVNDLQPWEGEPAAKRVMQHLNAVAAETAGGSTDEIIDLERTRMIRFRRCGWTRAEELHVAALQGSARPVQLQGPTVADLLKKLERWLIRGLIRVEPPEDVRYRPRIYARPQAHAWVMSGGASFYPWDA